MCPENLHGLDLEIFELAVTKLIDPGYWGHCEVDDEIKYIITVDPGAIAVMLLSPISTDTENGKREKTR